MPVADLYLKGYSLQAVQKALDMISDKARTTLGGDFELRDMRPQDLTFTNATFSFSLTATSSYHTIVNNGTIGNNRWIAIYGVRTNETAELITGLKITSGGALKMDRNIEWVSGTQDKSLYFDPVIVEQNTLVKIEGYNKGTTTDTGYVLAFLGIVAEKKGQVLAP